MSQLFVVCARWELLDENVVELLSFRASFALFSLLVRENLNCFIEKLNAFTQHSLFGNISVFKLDVTKPTAFSIRVLLQFARSDSTEFAECIEKLLLRDL